MGRLEQMRRGIERLVSADRDIGIITRSIKTDNGRGQLIPTGETVSHKIICRVGYQSGGAWPLRQWEGGLAVDAGPYVLALHDADLQQGDVLEWRGKKHSVGAVSRPGIGGGAACAQAPLAAAK
jgi:hypothetical protein